MPVYEHHCNTCGKTHEDFQWHFSDAPPRCCGHRTQRVASVAVAHFYGHGCYEVDYGKHFRNKDGKAFRQHHEGKIPRKLTDKSPEAVEERKEWG